MLRELDTWIDEAAVTLGIPLERLTQNDALLVTEEIRVKFVDGSPRVWWLGLKTPYTYYDSDSTRLSQVLPKLNGKLLLIPESDDEGPLAVLKIEATCIEKLIGACPFFEYYVVDSDKSWLVAETEHNIFIVCNASESAVNVLPGGRIWPTK
jgi:hypothetical protein